MGIRRSASPARLPVAALAAIALLFGILPLFAQAPPNPNLARVRYNTLKTTAKPQGEIKAQIDAIDRDLADATRLGRTGEIRRLYAKGTALLNGRTWTEADEFESSLVLRTDRVVVDTSMPHRVRLEQIYAPAIELTRPLTARATMRPAGSPGPARTNAPPTEALEVGRFEHVSRDLRESPLSMRLDLSPLGEGVHVLTVEVLDDERALGATTLRLGLQRDLATRLSALERAAAVAPEDVGADLRYPGDYIRKINEGLVELGTFNVSAELASAESIAAAAASGKHPFVGRTGDFERHYLLEPAGEIMPYRVYVPTSYDGTRAFPLVVALHGLGANEDSFFDSYSRTVPRLAEERGYIVVAPLGYRVDGFYGYPALAGTDAAARRRTELSELDVMEVLARARADYRIDEGRIYLMGHSMGAIGTWAIAARHPDIWAALAPFSGLGQPATVARMRHIPQIVVHGDADPTVPVAGSRAMVEDMRKLGVDVTYIEVPGGNHIDVVVPNLPAVFDFFDAKRKTAVTRQ